MSNKYKEIEEEFDEEFTREDGLIDKYSWYGCEKDDLGPNTTPQAIKIWLREKLQQREEEIRILHEALTELYDYPDYRVGDIVKRYLEQIKLIQE